MTRRHGFATVTGMLLVLLASTLAQAAEDPLKVIPQEALGFVLVNRLAQSDAKIQALGQEMQLPVPSPLGMFKARAGIEKALDEKGTAAIVIMPAGDDRAPAGWRPVAVLLLPVTDYGEFIRQLKAEDASAAIVEVEVAKQAWLVGHRGGYAVVARPRNRDLLKKVLESANSVSAGMGPWGEWLAEGELAGVLTRHGVEVLATKGQEALQQAKKGLAALPEDKKQGMEAAIGVFNVYEKMIKAAGEEVHSYGFAARLDEGGNLHVTERLRLTPDGQAAKMLSQVKPPEGDLLAGLPKGPCVFALAGALPESMGECLMQFSADVMKAAPGLYGLNQEQVDKLIEISRQSMKQLRGMSIMMGVGKPGDPIYSNIAVVEKVDDSKSFLADYQKTIQAMNRLVKQADGWILSTVKLREVEVAGMPALRLAMDIPMPPEAAKMPNYDEIMEKLFGPTRRMVVFIAAADEHTIVASYTGRRLLRESLRAAQGATPGLAGDPNLAKTAAMLPAGAPWVGYISPKGTIDYINRVIPALTPEGKTARKLPEFPETPPIGFAVKTAPEGLHSHTVVPAAVLKGIGVFAAEVTKQKAAQAAEAKAVEVP